MSRTRHPQIAIYPDERIVAIMGGKNSRQMNTAMANCARIVERAEDEACSVLDPECWALLWDMMKAFPPVATWTPESFAPAYQHWVYTLDRDGFDRLFDALDVWPHPGVRLSGAAMLYVLTALNWRRFRKPDVVDGDRWWTVQYRLSWEFRHDEKRGAE